MTIKEKVEYLNSIDKAASSQLFSLDAQISANQTALYELEHEPFATEFENKIKAVHTAANATVRELMAAQEKLDVDQKYLYKNYSNQRVPEIKVKTLVDDFVRAYTTFSNGVNAIMNDDKYSFSNPSFERNATEVAKAHAYIKAVFQSAPELTKKYLHNYIDQEINKYKDIIRGLENKKDSLIKETKTLLNNGVKELDTLKKENRSSLSMCNLSLDVVMEDSFYKSYRLCIGENINPNNSINLSLNNIGKHETINWGAPMFLPGYEPGTPGNIIIDETENEELAYTFVENLILNFIYSYPSKFKNVCVIDTNSTSKFNRIMPALETCGRQKAFVFKKNGDSSIVSDTQDINNTLDTLISNIKNTSRLLGGNYNSIYEYNHNQPDNARPITLVVYKNFPNGLHSDDHYKKLREIFDRGNQVGIISVIMLNFGQDLADNGEKYIFDLSKAKCLYNLNPQKDVFVSSDKSLHIKPISKSSNFDITRYLKAAEEELKKDSRPISIKEILSKEDFRTSSRRLEYSKELCIPIGKSGNVIQNLKLNSTDTSAHVIVSGSTGSGKTAFLHSLILNAAYNYSPDELEINLFDFKDGLGFSIFKEKKLPHIKFVSLENKLEEALDILNYLLTEMHDRSQRIKSQGNVNDITTYNALPSVRSGNLPNIPRMLVIIDEYHFLMDNNACLKDLALIARQGRAYGISLILVSQDVPSDTDFQQIKDEMRNRFTFRGEERNIEALIESFGNRSDELLLQKGLCFYSNDDKNVKLTRIAFSGDGADLSNNIDWVISKYKEYTPKLRLIESPTPLKVFDSSKIPQKSLEHTKHQMNQWGRYFIALGRYHMSNTPTEYYMDMDNPLLFVFGDYTQSKHIEALIIDQVLKTNHRLSITGDQIFYVDMMKNVRLLNRDTPIKRLINKREELIDNGDESLSGINFYTASMFDDVVEKVAEICDLREQGADASSPVLLMISGADKITDNNCIDRLKYLMESGKDYGVYVVLQFESTGSTYKSLTEYSSDIDVKNFIIVGTDETADFSSNNIISVLSALDRCILNLNMDGYINSLSANPLNPVCALLVNNGKLNKYRYYRLENSWLDSLVNELNH